MKEIHLEQGSEDWLAWRSGAEFTDIFGVFHKSLNGPRVTATAASICGGHSPYGTPHQLWGKTLGLRDKDAVSFAMTRGGLLEPKARKAYMDIVGCEYEALCIESTTQPWVAASLDGVNLLRSRGVEIKCPISERIHDMAMLGQVPDYHYDQMQWQMLASDNQIKEIDYFSYAPQIGVAAPITVKIDQQRQVELLLASEQYRLALITRIPICGTAFDQAGKSFLKLNREMKALDVHLDAAKELLKKLANGKPTQGGGAMVTFGSSDGRVSWEKVAMELAAQLAMTPNALELIKEKHKGKPSQIVSVKEAGDANAVYQELLDETKNDTVSIDIEAVEILQPAPHW